MLIKSFSARPPIVKSLFTATLFLALLIAGCGGGDRPLLSSMLKSKIDGELGALVNDSARPLSSLSVVAVRSGDVVYEGQFGVRSIENKLPADSNTLYRIASISKAVTAIGFMKLVDKGSVNLDADASTYLGFQLRNPAFAQDVITPRMLLSHTTSLRDPQDLLALAVGQDLATALMQTDSASGNYPYWAGDTAKRPSSQFFTYANVNFVVLATIIEKVSGQRFDQYMVNEVFKPLNIKAGYYPAGNLAASDYTNLSTLYRKRPDGGTTWDPTGNWFPQGPDRTGVMTPEITNLASYVPGSNAGVFGPQGNLRISARGLATLMQLLMNSGTLNGVTILKADTVTLMKSPQWSYNGSTTAPNGDTYSDLFFKWGLGLQVFTDRGGSAGYGDRVGSAAGGFTGVGHLGEAYGLLSGFIFDPVTKNGMIYVIGGLGADPNGYLGSYSAFYGWEEAILRPLYNRAILQSDT